VIHGSVGKSDHVVMLNRLQNAARVMQIVGLEHL
jgi:hypothetical protein